MNNYTVYGIENTITNRWYIGQTGNFERRKSQHLSRLRNQKHINPKLQAAFNKHGLRAFHWHILGEYETIEETLEVETYFIDKHDSFKEGYNQNRGGENRDDMYKPCEWEGVQYESIDQAANALGISYDAMQWRVSNGHTKESDLNGNEQRAIECTWNGKVYSSISEAANDNGYLSNVLGRHIGKGYTCDEDIRYDLSNPKERTWNGVTYPNLKVAAKKTGIPKTTLSRWIEQGYNCDEDVPKHPSMKTHIWEGIEYTSIKEAAKAHDIPYRTMVYYFRKGYTSISQVNKRKG